MLKKSITHFLVSLLVFQNAFLICKVLRWTRTQPQAPRLVSLGPLTASRLEATRTIPLPLGAFLSELAGVSREDREVYLFRGGGWRTVNSSAKTSGVGGACVHSPTLQSSKLTWVEPSTLQRLELMGRGPSLVDSMALDPHCVGLKSSFIIMWLCDLQLVT